MQCYNACIMSETRRNNPNTLRLTNRAKVLGAAGLLGVGALIGGTAGDFASDIGGGVKKSGGAVLERVGLNGDATTDRLKNEVENGHFVSVVAEQGDTAWDIARSAVGPEKEVRDLVEVLQEQAGADGLRAGEQLLIPESQYLDADPNKPGFQEPK